VAGYDFVTTEVRGRIGWLAYNRPPVNAFNRQMVEEVAAAFDALHADPAVRVIVFASALPRYFSSGADLKVFRAMRPEDFRSWVALCHDIARRLRASEKPLLAAIAGTAVGGGLEMTLHCDLRFAAMDARLGQPEIAIGFIPPIAATQALARLIGRPQAIRYLYDGELLSAETALKIGLVDQLCPPDRLHDEVQAYAESLAEKPRAALAAIRQCVTLGGGMTFEQGMALEAGWAARLAESADFAEGIAAFLEKRPPRWTD
jgi:enoyl-CoA hydratase/carnithine racemase